jgi:hypothetical protein
MLGWMTGSGPSLTLSPWLAATHPEREIERERDVHVLPSADEEAEESHGVLPPA